MKDIWYISLFKVGIVFLLWNLLKAYLERKKVIIMHVIVKVTKKQENLNNNK